MRSSTKVIELDKFSELQAAIIKNGEPTLFVLDLLLPGVKGTSAVTEVKKMYPEVPLAVLSSMPAGEAEETCIEAGADIYIEKAEAGADIYIEKATPSNEIGEALKGLFAAEAGDEETIPLGDTKLSKRQKQLIIMLDRGLGNREIAEELDISE
ncbi:MAG: hypothetical protein RL420_1337, partial [Pseudomonadota bacterium]